MWALCIPLSVKNMSKNVVYTKADKGNSIVILDNEDYKQKLEELLEHGQYLKMKKKTHYLNAKPVSTMS